MRVREEQGGEAIRGKLVSWLALDGGGLPMGASCRGKATGSYASLVEPAFKKIAVGVGVGMLG